MLSEIKKIRLREELNDDIIRYLYVNSVNRYDGGKRADIHMNISKTLCRYVFNLTSNNHPNIAISWVAVHDYLSHILTDKMDKVIGFPIYEPLYDVEIYANKFFA